MKRMYRSAAVAALIIAASASAFAWGTITHVYITDHLGSKNRVQHEHELYGAVLPDIYSTDFSALGLQLDAIFQYTDKTAWDAADKQTLPLAFGIMTHSEIYGADQDAHNSASGYIYYKGIEISPGLAPTIVSILMQGGVGEATAQAVAAGVGPMLGHGLAEYAIDILIRRQDDTQIGAKFVASALARPPEMQKYLGSVYAQRVADAAQISLKDAKQKLAADERAYRKQCVQYGTLFTVDEDQTIAQLSVLIAQAAETVLESVVLTDLTVRPSQTEALLRQAIPLVAVDYKPAVLASIAATDSRLTAAGITPEEKTHGRFALRKEGSDALQAVPTEFTLTDNYPNPFNPSTTLRYTVPEASAVRISVCDLLGRTVATLVDEVKESGVYTVEWNAGTLASGIYFCRLSAGPYVKTVRMMLQK